MAKMRVLVLTLPFPEYSLDLVVNGFSALGHEVVDFPPKELYHMPDEASPLSSQIPRHNFSFNDLKRISFDLCLVGCLPMSIDSAVQHGVGRELIFELIRLVEGMRIPVIAINGEDVLVEHKLYDEFFGESLVLEFTRLSPDEELKGRMRPITFGFKESRLLPVSPQRKRFLSFFAGSEHGQGSIVRAKRTMVAEILNTRQLCLGILGKKIPYTTYREMLGDSFSGVSVRGGCWDSLRYWEIPGMGACLISDRIGERIQVVNDFLPFEEALFYDFQFDPLDRAHPAQKLIEALNWVENNKDEVLRMAKRAQEKVLDCHTTKRRAEYVLSEFMGL